jgi:prepilin-type N-terminal cleavage/methylation domain-containing protein
MKMKTNRKGFSLVEMMIAVAIFSIVAGAAFELFTRHQALFTKEQDVVSLSLDLRNALGQIQIDMSNAGTGVFPGANVPNWPVGVTIINSNPGGGCYDAATQTYQANCFDTMNIVAANQSVPPLHPETLAGGCITTTTSTMYSLPAAGLTAAQTAALFAANDIILLVKSDGSQMTVVTLTGAPSVSSGKVLFPHTTTAVDGSGTDPLNITNNANPRLGSGYCNNDWLIKLDAITYSVDVATDATNPRLVRTRGGQTDLVTDQVVGFKIGVSLWNQVTLTSSEAYDYDSSNYGFDYPLIRSVRLQVIGRTRPNLEPSYTYRNPFDQGPYQIQPVSLVVNPRNLSLKD